MDFRLRDFRYPISIYKFRHWLAKNEKSNPKQIEKWQLKKLKEIINHAYKQTDYYRSSFDRLGIKPQDLRSLKDLSIFPFLTKDDIRENLSLLKAKNAAENDPIVNFTSGSTGTALKFYLDKNTNILEFASLWRIFNWAGYRFGNRFCDLRARKLGKDQLWSFDLRLNSLNLSSFNFKKENASFYAKLLRFFKPVMIRGFPSSINLLATWFQEMGIKDIHPKAIVTSSEALLSYQRKNLEQVFGCPVFDYYGQMERVALISQCQYGTYHVHSEYGYLEIINAKGKPAKKGEIGEIVATSFHNRAMPFIRYKTRDLAAFSKKKCACRLPYPAIEKIYGRKEDMIITPDGRCVARLDMAFKYSLGIRYAQIIQEKVNALTVKIVKDKNYSPKDEERLLKELRLRLGQMIKIKIEIVSKIPLTSAGKLKFSISKIKPIYE